MPETPQGPNPPPPPEAARYEAQLFLGQLHGVVDLSVTELKRVSPTSDGDMTREDVLAAYVEVARNFGILQAALNTGEYDEALVGVGFAGAQWVPKKKRWQTRLREFFVTKGNQAHNYIVRKRDTLKWGGTLLRSLTAAFKKEIDRVPLAAAAGEALGEFIEVLRNATDPSEKGGKGTTDAG